MNDKDTSQLDFSAMLGTTRQAFEFMKKLLEKYGKQVQTFEDKLVNLYF